MVPSSHMRLVAVAVVFVALTACSKKHAGPKPRCIVTARMPGLRVEAVKAQAPTCSVTIIAKDETTSFADVVATMDELAKAGFVDFGIGDVVSKLPAPATAMTASRTTNEGLIIGRFDGMVSAPVIVVAASGDVSVGGESVGKADDPGLASAVRLALAKHMPATGSDAPPASVVISAPGTTTFATVYRIARGADDLGYASFLFSLKN